MHRQKSRFLTSLRNSARSGSSPGEATDLSPALQCWGNWNERFESRRDDRVLTVGCASAKLSAEFSRDSGRFCVKTFQLISCIAVLVCSSFGQGMRPAKGFVPDSKTATRIAEAVLIAIYGEAVLSDRPFKAKLEHGTWTVVGTLHCQENLPRPDFYCAGGHWVRLSKDDGRILQVGDNTPLNN